MKILFTGSLLLFCFSSSIALANAPSIPKQFLGVWDEKVSNCSPKGADLAQSSQSIDAHSVNGYENSCTLKSITKVTAHSMTGQYDCNDEDGDSESTFKLDLKAHKLVVGTSDIALVRCQ